jgi:hypothetical protein
MKKLFEIGDMIMISHDHDKYGTGGIIIGLTLCRHIEKDYFLSATVVLLDDNLARTNLYLTTSTKNLMLL